MGAASVVGVVRVVVIAGVASTSIVGVGVIAIAGVITAAAADVITFHVDVFVAKILQFIARQVVIVTIGMCGVEVPSETFEFFNTGSEAGLNIGRIELFRLNITYGPVLLAEQEICQRGEAKIIPKSHNDFLFCKSTNFCRAGQAIRSKILHELLGCVHREDFCSRDVDCAAISEV